MKTIYLAKPEDVARDWPKVEAMIERCVAEAVKGEYTAEDIKFLALKGDALLFYVPRDDGTAVLAGALEIVRYPRMVTLNVMAIAGEDLENMAAENFEEMKAFARSIGANCITAATSPAMARLLTRLGAVHTYNIVRFPLEA